MQYKYNFLWTAAVILSFVTLNSDASCTHHYRYCPAGGGHSGNCGPGVKNFCYILDGHTTRCCRNETSREVRHCNKPGQCAKKYTDDDCNDPSEWMSGRVGDNT
jgi:hypothetical protein